MEAYHQVELDLYGVDATNITSTGSLTQRGARPRNASEVNFNQPLYDASTGAWGGNSNCLQERHDQFNARHTTILK